jgi:APA family basic amino acid/polyamine antiporter
MSEPRESPSRLARRLGTSDAVVLGLGSMIGAGIFAAVGPAAEAAGSGLLIGLGLAAVVAFANATSSARLAAVHPLSGGTYVYGTRQLGPFWGYAAGWAFVIGKTASCAAIALTFARYAVPELARPAAASAVIALTAVNYRGVRKTATLTWVLVVAVVGVLAVFVVATLLSDVVDARRLSPLWPEEGAWGVLRSAGLMFFAFAGYARVATLGEEVADPATTIPRAVSLSVVAALGLYAAVTVTALVAVGPAVLARSPAPVEAAAAATGLAFLEPVVRVGAVVATLGVLLSLLAGLSRTVFAMAADRALPHALAAVHPRFRVPHRAEVAVGIIVAAAAAFAPLEEAIGLSAFTVLLYYAITNASALTLRTDQRRGARWLPWFGIVGCLALAGALPLAIVAVGAGLLLVAWALYGAGIAHPAGGAEEGEGIVEGPE